MSAFAGEIEERDLRERLNDALTGKGAFRRFRDVLERYPDLRDAWRARRAAWLERYARQWLAEIGVEAELVRPAPIPEPPPRPVRRARRPSLLEVLLLGAPDGKTEIIHGQVVRRAPGGGAPRALFKDLVRELCDWKGVGYRKRFIEDTDRFKLEEVEVRIRGGDVEVLVDVPADVVAMFFR